MTCLVLMKVLGVNAVGADVVSGNIEPLALFATNVNATTRGMEMRP
jgi:hypothetical protein